MDILRSSTIYAGCFTRTAISILLLHSQLTFPPIIAYWQALELSTVGFGTTTVSRDLQCLPKLLPRQQACRVRFIVFFLLRCTLSILVIGGHDWMGDIRNRPISYLVVETPSCLCASIMFAFAWLANKIPLDLCTLRFHMISLRSFFRFRWCNDGACQARWSPQVRG